VSRRISASCEQPTFTCGPRGCIVSGLLLTMKTATRTCESSAGGDSHRTRHGARGRYSALSHPNSGLPEFGHLRLGRSRMNPTSAVGEGGSVLPHAMMGEGVVCREEPPHPFEFAERPLCPLPQGERAPKATAPSIEFSEPRSRSRERNRAQSQGCGFSLFSSCSALLSTAKSGDPRDAGRADFSFSSRRLRDTRSAGLWPAACFFFGYLQENTGPWGVRLRTLPMPQCITTSRVSAGARSRD